MEHDGHVGQVLDKLKEAGLDGNTIVMYSTDDGSVAAMGYHNRKITFLEQERKGLDVWQQPFTELRAPKLSNLRMALVAELRNADQSPHSSP